ncbi:hypothetical protein [Gelidibacter pelagius]|uniref:Uncharacterized protein n=1 Tax=Gelidibacter pelagius TaxID=2819985 RepID=A0ABS3SWQ6_9FLAO|nr:hypothetical protein [Gelidibacter pelagius]MBO3100149.1 hypothetical protein [Gelidibacter pelagius]
MHLTKDFDNNLNDKPNAPSAFEFWVSSRPKAGLVQPTKLNAPSAFEFWVSLKKKA